MKDVPSWDRCKKDDNTPWDEAAYLREHASNVLALAFYYTLKVGTLCCLGDYRWGRLAESHGMLQIGAAAQRCRTGQSAQPLARVRPPKAVCCAGILY